MRESIKLKGTFITIFMCLVFIVLSGTINALTLCRVGQKCCQVNLQNVCYDTADAPARCLNCIDDESTIMDTDLCSGVGDKKYTATLCSYTTKECCSNGTWADEGKCPKTCSEETKPDTSESCGTNGTRTRTVSCDTATGNWKTGAWGTYVEKVCTPGEVGKCPTNCYQRRVCNSSGTAWGKCSCYDPSNAQLIAFRNTYQNSISSDLTCEAHCCPSGSTPIATMYNAYLNKNAGTGCEQVSATGGVFYASYVGCIEKDTGIQTFFTGYSTSCEY